MGYRHARVATADRARIRNPHNSADFQTVPAGTVATVDQAYVTFTGQTVRDYSIPGRLGAWQLAGDDWAELDSIPRGHAWREDSASSVSSQHYIDTGHRLDVLDVAATDLDAGELVPCATCEAI